MIIDIVRHTPLWVFFLFALLVALGARQTRPSRIPAVRLIVLPIAMSGLSLYGVLQAGTTSALGVLAWSTLVAALVAIGLRRPPRRDVQYSTADRSFALPGSWLPLGLMMAIFFTKYATAVLLALHPLLARSDAFVIALGAISGIASGCFAARALRIWRARNISSVAAARDARCATAASAAT